MTLKPFERFLHIEISSSQMLFSMTIIALVWANSPLSELYHRIWNYKLTIGLGNYMLSQTLLHWINDGLMAIFFFVIGLEIKREILTGELTTFKKSALPIFAAIGGMAAPGIIFLLLNTHPETAQGWGIVIATDIAFSLGILQLLGRRAPLPLKIFLTVFAIADDIGAVLVIAIFYSSDIYTNLILISLGIWAVLMALGYFRLYSRYLFSIGAFVMWILMLKSGIHPTIAGVLMAFTIPVRKRKLVLKANREIRDALTRLDKQEPVNKKGILTKEQLEAVNDIEESASLIQSPLQHLENKLHGWVSLLIMPLFALANAGVPITPEMFDSFSFSLVIAASLFFGKVIGVSSMSYLAIRTRIGEITGNMGFRHIFGASFLGGVGFTMSLFIANLAFPQNPVYLNAAKAGIIMGSFVSGLAGFLVIRSFCKESD